ncbi:MAG: NAD(P)H-hydrate epimerase, partial [Endozoicomonas sp.]
MDRFLYQERYRESLPDSLYTAEQVRQLDHLAITRHGIPGFELMSRAANAVIAVIVDQWPGITGLMVLCGAGNNGGDGYLVARLASDKSIPVSVLALKDPATLTGDAQQAFQACVKAGVSVMPYEPGQPLEGGVIVDAMLGTGLSGEVRGHYQSAIQQLNNSGRPICSVDVPSGLCADTGSPLGEAVKADLTVSFIGLKQGLLTGKGPEYTGQLMFNDLGVPAEIYQEVAPGCHRINRSSLQGLIQSRPRTTHKGDFGHVLLVGGNHGMPGAITLAAEAAIHCGAGKVSVATRKHHLNALAIRTPEIMATGVKTRGGLKALLPGKTVIVIGPGLGQDEWALRLLKDALAFECPLVLDAD